MKNRRLTVLALVVLAGMGDVTAAMAEPTAGPGQPPAPPAAPPAALVAQTLLDEMREASGVPGLGAAVVLQGKLVWQGSSGLRDLEKRQPMDADTRFRLASVSKLFTATALARLAQDGLIDPLAPLSAQADLPAWLPEGWGAITPAQLAAHTAGVPHYELRDAGRGRLAFDTAQHAAQTHLAGRTLLAEPGKHYRYSSWGYTLLSAVVEARSGLGFVGYLSRHVAPGLAITPDVSDSRSDDRSSRSYQLTPAGARVAEPHDYSYSWGGAGLAATPGALALWGGRVMQGELLSERWRQWMWSPQQLADGQTVRERGDAVGIGWRLGQDLQGLPLRHHAGASVGARSALLLWPTLGLSVGLLSNASWTTAIERNAELLSAPFRPPPTDLVASPCPAGAHTLAFSHEGLTHGVPAHFSDEAGLCRASLELPDALAKAFSAKPQTPRRVVQLVALAPGLSRAALATPLGLLEWRAIDAQAAQLRLPGDRVIAVRWL